MKLMVANDGKGIHKAMKKLSKKEFQVLNAVREMPNVPQRALAKAAGVSLGSANALLKEFRERELVDDSGITSVGFKALEPHKVQNAVIMAAGLSSRFAPISCL